MTDRPVVYVPQERVVSATAYYSMLATTHAGWIVGTLLYHYFN